MQNKRISNQLVVKIFIIWMVVLTVGLGTMAVIIAPEMISQAKIQSHTKLKDKEDNVIKTANTFYQNLIDIKTTLESTSNGEFSFIRDRNAVINLLQSLKERDSNIKIAWITYEKNNFDGKNDEFINDGFYDETGEFRIQINDHGIMPLQDISSENYYKEIKSTGLFYITDPHDYKDDYTDDKLVTIAMPIMRGDTFIGAIGIDISTSILNMLLGTDTHDSESMILLLNRKNEVFVCSDESQIGKNISEITSNPNERIKKIENLETDEYWEDNAIVISHPIKVVDYLGAWRIIEKIPTNVIYQQLVKTILIVTVVVMLFVFFCMWYLFRFIRKKVQPIENLSKSAEIIANGNLTQVIDIESDNEIGVLAKMFTQMSDNLKNFVKQIQEGSVNINNASNQLQQNSGQVSENANEQASVSEEISSNMEEMAAGIQQTAERGGQILKFALDTVDTMKRLKDNTLMINDLSVEIKGLSSNNNDISRQIKILALNASVEAARAGDFGKGFAVVAKEVQKLSEHTTNATNAMSEKIDVTFEQIQNTMQLVEDLNPQLLNLTDNIQEITATVKEQEHGINQVAKGLQQLNQTSQSNAANAEEFVSTTEEMNAQAESLQKLTVMYKV